MANNENSGNNEGRENVVSATLARTHRGTYRVVVFRERGTSAPGLPMNFHQALDWLRANFDENGREK